MIDVECGLSYVRLYGYVYEAVGFEIGDLLSPEHTQ